MTATVTATTTRRPPTKHKKMPGGLADGWARSLFQPPLPVCAGTDLR